LMPANHVAGHMTKLAILSPRGSLLQGVNHETFSLV